MAPKTLKQLSHIISYSIVRICTLNNIHISAFINREIAAILAHCYSELNVPAGTTVDKKLRYRIGSLLENSIDILAFFVTTGCKANLLKNERNFE